MDTSKVCRMCLCGSAESVNLFDNIGTELRISSIIAQHFWFEPSEADGFSHLICMICWSNLKQFHEFYECVKLAQETLIAQAAPPKHENGSNGQQNNNINVDNVETIKRESIKFELPDNPNDDADNAIKYDSAKSCSSDTDEQKYSKRHRRKSTQKENSIVKKRRGRSINLLHSDDDDDDESNVKTHQISNDSQLSPSPPQSLHGDDDDDDDDYHNDNDEKDERDESPVMKKRRGRPPKHLARPKKEISEQKQKEMENEKLEKKSKKDEEDQNIREFFQLSCKMCDFRSITFVGVKMHYRQEHSIKRGYVMCCDKKFFRRGRILEHIAWHRDPETFRCPICLKTYQDTQGLKIHMPNHATEDERIYKCDMCGKTFAKKYNLSQHIRTTHIPDSLKIHKCPTCGKSFGSKSILQCHIRGVHNFAYASVCDICAKVFKSKAQCALHRQEEHSAVRKERVQCSICATWHKNENGLYKHIRRSHQQLPQSCEICGKVSPNRDALRSHIRYVHEIERLHKCSVCDKAFKKPIELKEHMASHTGGILYVCSYCPKTFNSNANMHSHRKKAHPMEWQEDRDRRNGPRPK